MSRVKSGWAWVLGLAWMGLLCAGTGAAAQAAAAKPEFDVASVRPSQALDQGKLRAMVQAGKMPRFGEHIDGLSAEYIRMTLKQLIGKAYGVQDYPGDGSQGHHPGAVRHRGKDA